MFPQHLIANNFSSFREKRIKENGEKKQIVSRFRERFKIESKDF